MNGFNARRFALARRRRGLNKQQLAGRLRLSRRAISAFESGDAVPSQDTLGRIVEALGFTESFFYLEDPTLPSPEDTSFRALYRMRATQRDAVLAAGALAFELNSYLEEQFDLPLPNLPDLGGEEPEAAAASLRAHWGLGKAPIRNVVHLLEANGVRVFSVVEECREIDAYSIWRDRPFVFLSTQKSGERGRFDAAHEAGHIVLHRHGAPNGREAENEAHRFASAFLMPPDSVIEHAPRLPALPQLLRLKKVWGVSIAALARRLRDLNLLSRWQYEDLCVRISKRGWRTNEPEGIPRERSKLLETAFAGLRADGISRATVAERLGLTEAELDSLTFGLTLTAVPGGNDTGDRPRDAGSAHLKLVK